MKTLVISLFLIPFLVIGGSTVLFAVLQGAKVELPTPN
jgi:hypothetical protein